MSESDNLERSIFLNVVDLESPAAQVAYLDEACAGDPQLRQKIDELLAGHGHSGDIFDRAEIETAVAFKPVAETVGTQIGPYTIREQIGEGGMGVVYVAEQTEPIRRKVALKIIKPGMDTKQVIARFEAERQTLALMDHPNIAKILDAGTTGGAPQASRGASAPGSIHPAANAARLADASGSPGRPYFVMELVKGVPITEFCDAQQLNLRQRLELFTTVCRAVQHAHQKGIMHRDIKPSNVMVTLHDGKPVPKVIDFGVSKALSQKLTDKTVYTAYGQMVGTPLYMSPEQAEMSGLDVDTRTDVYALGVLLYELLTGTTPFDKETLKKAGFDELRRIIREDEPPRPSARISTLNAELLSTVSDNREIDVRKLGRTYRGELDWIVMKALEKDRDRRYETASAFAADVERYLSDEPVEACPPSTAYRFRKFGRRNKSLLTTAALVFITMIAGTGGSLWQAGEAEDARQAAEDSEKLADQRSIEADNARQLAHRRFVDADNQRVLAATLAARSLVDRGTRALNEDDSLGLLDLLEARITAGRIPELSDSIGRLWAIGHDLYDQRLVQVLPGADALAFSPDGKLLATTSGNAAQLWDSETGLPHCAPLRLGKHIQAVVFSPDGKWLAAHSIEGVTRLWYTATGRPVGPLLQQKHEIEFDETELVGWPASHRTAAFSPDGTLLATSAIDGSVNLWNAATGQRYGESLWAVAVPRVTHQGGPRTASPLAFSSDGRLFASGSKDFVRLWDITSGQPHGKPLQHDSSGGYQKPEIMGPGCTSTTAVQPGGRVIGRRRSRRYYP